MDIDTMPAGHKLDELVAQKVMGCKLMKFSDGFSCCGCENHPHDHGTHEGYNYIKPYSTDIAAAWEAVEKMIERGDRPRLAYVYPAGTWAFESFTIPSYGETVPLAICRAALKACL